jgi:hypothetical protein
MAKPEVTTNIEVILYPPGKFAKVYTNVRLVDREELYLIFIHKEERVISAGIPFMIVELEEK